MEQDKADQIVAEAAKVFMRYGFRRVTMGELAKAAGMSRPALYLEFDSKEQIFIEVVNRLTNENLKQIREGIARLKSVDKKLELAFEVWTVRPFEMIQSSPDAADLYDSVKEFAAEAILKSAVEFENLLAEILELEVRKQKKLKLSAKRIARIMRTSSKGFHLTANDASELREMIRDMRRIVLASS
tara:strand:- start:674050 stop:674607 length:558 start_codon:yes stop_codon:yes gene_type:complete